MSQNAPPVSSLLESLESRLAPAGVVTLALTNGVLTLTGDTAANDFQITENGNQWTIESLAGGTTQFKLGLNGALQSSISFAAPLSVKATLGAGADEMLLSNITLPGTLTVDTGDGHDTVDLTGASIGGLVSVRMGTGSDYFTAGGGLFFGKGLSVDLGNGANTFEINTASLTSNGNISALGGGTLLEKQTFILAAGVGTVNGAVTLRTTTTSSTDFEVGGFAGDDLYVKGAMTLQAAGGDDKVLLAGTLETGGLFTMNLGHGQNSVATSGMEALFVKGLSYVGGSGQDSVTLNGTTLSITGNLAFNAGAGTNLLDVNPSTSVAITGALIYSGGVGADTLLLDGPSVSVGGAVSMAASAGNNAFALQALSANVGAVAFSAAAGNDTVDVGAFDGASTLVTVRGAVTINTGAGSADVMVRDADIYGNLAITTVSPFGGVDTVQLLDSDFRGAVSINLAGNAESDVIVRDGIFDRTVTINTGNGDDYVQFDTDTAVSSIYSWFGGAVRISLGAGNDIFAAGSTPQVATVGNDFNSYVDVNGGYGYDRAYFIHAGYNNGFNGPLPWTVSVEEVY